MNRPRFAGRASKFFLAVIVGVALLPVAQPAAAAPGDGHGDPTARRHAKTRVIVGFKPNASRVRRSNVVTASGGRRSGRISRLAPDTTVVRLAQGQTVAQAIDDLSGQRGVAYVEPDYWVKVAESSNDPYYTNGNQWGMYGDGTTPSNKFGSGAGEAWAKGRIGKSSVYVGVIDEGIKRNHPDLRANVWTNPHETANGLDDDGNGFVDDIHGWDFHNDDPSIYDGPADDHGTHVAGTIGARGGNGTGVAGVNWRITMIPAKFLGLTGGWSSDAARALDYLTDLKGRHGLNIVATSNSWGGGDHSQTLLDAINRAGDAGILFVAAAGNGSKNIDVSSHYPASYQCTTKEDGTARGWDCLISVANIRSNGALSGSSNWGGVGVDLGAPGSGIFSTVPKSGGGNGYASYSGTSMAAPHVTGAVALCASLDSKLTARQIRGLVVGSAKATGSLAGKTTSGDRLDIGALSNQCAGADPGPTPTPSPHPAGKTLTVDERSAWFTRSGSGWKHAKTGHANHHYWVPARTAAKKRVGAWRPVFEQPGSYEIRVKIAPYHSSSRRAVYKVRAKTGWTTRVRNQFRNRGKWVSLGIHQLGRFPIVLLADKTGEKFSLRRRLAYDAVRFIPVEAPVANQATPSKSTSQPVSEAQMAPPSKSAADPQPSAGPTPAPTQPPSDEPAPEEG